MLAALLLCVGSGLAAGTEQEPPPSLLLIASPQLQDPNFARAVVLVTQTPDGPFGFILNRPLALTVGEALPDAGAAVAALPLHFGGPVTRQAVGVLFSAENEPPGARRVMAGSYLSLDQRVIERILRTPTLPRRLRFFAGYAGWAPGQLERELARGDWAVWPADEATVFDVPATEMWPLLHGRAGARRAEGASRFLAARGLPRDLTLFGGAFLDDLEEDLVLTNHAELDPGPLLDGRSALLEIPDLGVESRVACAQAAVMLALRLQLPLQVAHRGPAALAHPQRILQRAQEEHQHGGEQLHWRSW